MGFLECVDTILNSTDLSCLTKSGHAVCLAHRLMPVCFSLAGELKGLFLLFAAHVIKHAAQLLDLLNVSKTGQ